MATIVKLGEPKPPAKKEEKKGSSGGAGQVEIDSGLLIKIGAGVGVLAVIGLICFFLFRGPSEESGFSGTGLPGGGMTATPMPGIGGAPATGATPVAVPGAHSPGAPRVGPATVPGSVAAPVGDMPPGVTLPGGGGGMSGVTTTRNNAMAPGSTGSGGGFLEKTGQPGPNEDPYTRENR